MDRIFGNFLVNSLVFERRIGQHRNLGLRNLREAGTHYQFGLLAVLKNPHLSWRELGHQGDVGGINTKFSVAPGQDHHIDVVLIRSPFGSYDLELQFRHRQSTFGANFVDAASHVEILLGHIVVLAIENLFESANRLLGSHIFTLFSGEYFGNVERLAEETLDFSGPIDRQFIVRAQLIHPENGNDILQIFVPLQYPLDTTRDIVMLLADKIRRQGLRGRCQRIHCRINSKLGNGTVQNDGRIEMGERIGGRRIG